MPPLGAAVLPVVALVALAGAGPAAAGGRESREACLLQHQGNTTRRALELDSIGSSGEPGSHGAHKHAEAPAAAPQASTPGKADPVPKEEAVAKRDVRAAAADGQPSLDVDPFWALRVELHLPLRLRDIHTGLQGPVQDFLATVRKEFSAAASLPATRVVLLDVRGENTTLSMLELSQMPPGRLLELFERPDLIRFDSPSLLQAAQPAEASDSPEGAPGESPKKGAGEVEEKIGKEEAAESATTFDCEAGFPNFERGWSSEKKAWCCKTKGKACPPPPSETVVDFEVLPGISLQDPSPASALRAWQAQLTQEDSFLLQGPLAKLLKDATLVMGRLPKGPATSGRSTAAAEEVAVTPLAEGGARRACGVVVVAPALLLALAVVF